jgi:nucleoside-diphosphate-sugar epimerase
MQHNTDFNIGNDRFYTILELAQIIWQRYGDGRPFKYEALSTPANTALRREVDITKARELLGWSPITTLEDGLLPTAKWIQDRPY